jgi:hypothetical protein
MIDPEKIFTAVQNGLSFVCATCERYWEARDKNVPDDMCMAKEGCGSPIAGSDFHEYKGFLTSFDRFCFVCGNQATHNVRVKNSVRVFGSCSECLEMIKTLQPVDGIAPTLKFLDKNGNEVSASGDGKVHLKLV